MKGPSWPPLLCQEGRGEGVSAAKPIVNDLKAEIESPMVDKHDRLTKLEDLNREDWPLDNSFNVVTEPERIISASSPCYVSSSSFLHETSFQTYQALNQKLDTLEQQMYGLSILLAESDLRREKLLARALAQLQSISAATIKIPNDSEVEPMTLPTKDMVVDPIFLDTAWLIRYLVITSLNMDRSRAIPAQVIRKMN